jgi:capsular polysaccharide transport system ATP-binding protein
MIRAEGLTKYYRVQGKKRYVFENLNLELPPGGRLGLVGPNGAGKSTLLRVLSGVEKPNSGRIIRDNTLSWPIGVTGGFIGNLTGRENVKFVCQLFECTRAETLEKLEFVEDFADIGEYFNMPLTTYSSGMRSRVGFGLSMAFEFDYYIVDETLAVGDATFQAKCKRVLDERVKGKGLILVSHSMPTIKKFCDQGMFLKPGELTYSKNIDDLIKMYKDYCAKR